MPLQYKHNSCDSYIRQHPSFPNSPVAFEVIVVMVIHVAKKDTLSEESRASET